MAKRHIARRLQFFSKDPAVDDMVTAIHAKGSPVSCDGAPHTRTIDAQGESKIKGRRRGNNEGSHDLELGGVIALCRFSAEQFEHETLDGL